MQLIDGEIVSVDVTGDAESAQIEIPHFSEVVTVVLQTWGEEAAVLARQELDRLAPSNERAARSPASFLRTCLGVMSGVFTSWAGRSELLDDIVTAACTNALIRRSAPDGQYVSDAVCK